MKLSKLCQDILFGEDLDSKLLAISKVDIDNIEGFKIPNFPGRNEKIQCSEKRLKFPRGHFHEVEKKAMALHSFANHELLAIEMMACALLIYPSDTPELVRFKRGVIASLKDEQKHFQLYIHRLNQLGYEFGDFPINDFFWSQMHNLKTPSQYLAVMSLTFEAANLDFAHFYKHVFLELGDQQTANILDIVLDDEVGHVNLGVHYLSKWKGSMSLWDYYNESLPFPITPARAKGKSFVEHVRKKAKMDEDFIEKVKNYSDSFKVTERREWKK